MKYNILQMLNIIFISQGLDEASNILVFNVKLILTTFPQFSFSLLARNMKYILEPIYLHPINMKFTPSSIFVYSVLLICTYCVMTASTLR